MWMHDPRTLILRALILDAAGQLLILGIGSSGFRLSRLDDRWQKFGGSARLAFVFAVALSPRWVGCSAATRCCAGGVSPCSVLLQRLVITAAVSLCCHGFRPLAH